MLKWIRKPHVSFAGPWEIGNQVEPIPQLPEDQSRKAAEELIGEALKSPDPIQGLITADAILKASIDLRVRVLIDEANQPGKPQIACAKGCGHCCCVSVSSFPFEIFAIADHVRRTWNWWARWKLLKRIRDYRKKAKALKRDEQFPNCPFLQNECCSIHEVRPTICRTHHSTDVQACIRNRKARPPGAQPFYRSTVPLYDGVYRALGDRGGFPSGLDMAAAVGVALENPNALSQFSEGKDPFVSAQKRKIAPPRR